MKRHDALGLQAKRALERLAQLLDGVRDTHLQLVLDARDAQQLEALLQGLGELLSATERSSWEPRGLQKAVAVVQTAPSANDGQLLGV